MWAVKHKDQLEPAAYFKLHDDAVRWVDVFRISPGNWSITRTDYIIEEPSAPGEFVVPKYKLGDLVEYKNVHNEERTQMGEIIEINIKKTTAQTFLYYRVSPGGDVFEDKITATLTRNPT